MIVKNSQFVQYRYIQVVVSFIVVLTDLREMNKNGMDIRFFPSTEVVYFNSALSFAVKIATLRLSSHGDVYLNCDADLQYSTSGD